VPPTSPPSVPWPTSADVGHVDDVAPVEARHPPGEALRGQHAVDRTAALDAAAAPLVRVGERRPVAVEGREEGAVGPAGFAGPGEERGELLLEVGLADRDELGRDLRQRPLQPHLLLVVGQPLQVDAVDVVGEDHGERVEDEAGRVVDGSDVDRQLRHARPHDDLGEEGGGREDPEHPRALEDRRDGQEDQGHGPHDVARVDVGEAEHDEGDREGDDHQHDRVLLPLPERELRRDEQHEGDREEGAAEPEHAGQPRREEEVVQDVEDAADDERERQVPVEEGPARLAEDLALFGAAPHRRRGHQAEAADGDDERGDGEEGGDRRQLRRRAGQEGVGEPVGQRAEHEGEEEGRAEHADERAALRIARAGAPPADRQDARDDRRGVVREEGEVGDRRCGEGDPTGGGQRHRRVARREVAVQGEDHERGQRGEVERQVGGGVGEEPAVLGQDEDEVEEEGEERRPAEGAHPPPGEGGLGVGREVAERQGEGPDRHARGEEDEEAVERVSRVDREDVEAEQDVDRERPEERQRVRELQIDHPRRIGTAGSGAGRGVGMAYVMRAAVSLRFSHNAAA
jgi:hypothetical protein